MRPPPQPPRRHDLRVVRDPADPDARRTAEHVVQLHIQKTSGTSLGQFLRRFFPVDEQLIDSPTGRASTELWPAAVAEGRRFFQGHVQLAHVRELLPEAHVVTMVRDPVERVVSQYLHYRRSHEVGASLPEDQARSAALAAGIDLDGWLSLQESGERCYTADRQVIALGSGTRHHAEDGSLERAVEALRGDVVCFGTAERQQEALRLLCDALLLDPAWARFGEHLNIGPTDRPAIDPRTRRRIEEQNALDVELHAAAEELLAERVAALDRRAPLTPPAAPTPDPPGVLLDPGNGGLRGPGLHEPEHVDDPNEARVWTGAGDPARVPFEADLSRRLLRITLRASGSATPAAWDELVLSLDGTPAAVVHRWIDDEAAHLVCAAVATSDAVHWIELSGPTGPEGEHDRRTLGVALRDLVIEPWPADASSPAGVEELQRSLAWATDAVASHEAAVAQRDEALAWTERRVAELEAVVVARDEALAWLEGRIAELEAVVAERDEAVRWLQGVVDGAATDSGEPAPGT